MTYQPAVSQTVHAHFSAQAARTPDAIAVSAVSSPARLTYRQLDERANRLAHRLLALGVRPQDPVAVLMERSVELVVAILATLKAGAFYLPLHNAYPLERKQWIVNQTRAPVLLADESMRERGLPRGTHVVIVGPETGREGETSPSSDPAVAPDPDQLAYVMYTSGSTGEPKGVAITHRDALGLALDGIWESGRHERVLMVAPYAFNVSTYELWVPLLHGGRIVVAPHGDLDVSALSRMIADEGITGIHLTAGLFRIVAEQVPEALRGVREVLTGGDVIAPAAVKKVLDTCPDLVVRAMYGATETTLFSTHSPMTAPYETAATVPVGQPMDNVRTYILDERLEPVRPGGVGDLYIAGRGLARGYYGRPDLTEERFVANPFGAPGERMYRTGDLFRLNSDGLLEFVGRADDLVKIMGFRVELGEIEAVLARFPGLAHVAVVARETEAGEKRLVAYFVTASGGPADQQSNSIADGQIEPAALRAHALRLLPEYMVPAAYVPVDALPLTPNGKLDRRALPEPVFDQAAAYRAPAGPRQELLCKVFAEVLDVPLVGVDDSFFELGGQSLSALRLLGRVRTLLGADVPIGEFFDAPTVAGLDDRLSSDD